MQDYIENTVEDIIDYTEPTPPEIIDYGAELWIIKAEGTPTFVYECDMQEGDRKATAQEIKYIEKYGTYNPDLAEEKQQATSTLRELRKFKEYGGFTLNGQHWDSAEKDELRLNSITKLFESGVPSFDGWKISEDVYITLTPEIAQQASMAFMQHYAKCFAVEHQKKAEIENCATLDQLSYWLEHNLNAGW